MFEEMEKMVPEVAEAMVALEALIVVPRADAVVAAVLLKSAKHYLLMGWRKWERKETNLLSLSQEQEKERRELAPALSARTA